MQCSHHAGLHECRVHLVRLVFLVSSCLQEKPHHVQMPCIKARGLTLCAFPQYKRLLFFFKYCLTCK